MNASFDLVVVGTGSAGTAAATVCRKAGWRVAIVDSRPFGGTCALRGCDPKKVLVGAAELIDWFERMHGSGIVGDARIDWPELMAFKRTFTQPVPDDRERSYRESGIVAYHGTARFTGTNSLRVGDEHLEARHVVIATGAQPAHLGIEGEALLATSDDFLDLDLLPRHVTFVGGGYIAFEFAHLSARAGATAVVLQRGPRVLTGFDPELVDGLVSVSREIGIDVRVHARVHSVARGPNGFLVRADIEGRETEIETDAVFHAAGRAADLGGLALEAGNVARTSKGVAVNAYFQSTSNPCVYAAGDCADGGGLPLTPVASDEGAIVARNLLEGNRHTAGFSGLTSIVYTIPALGMTGMTQEQACSNGLHFTVHSGDTSEWYSSRRVRARMSKYRMLVDDDGCVVGAHVLSPHAEELLNLFSLAICARVPAQVLKEAMFAYPTASSDVSSML